MLQKALTTQPCDGLLHGFPGQAGAGVVVDSVVVIAVVVFVAVVCVGGSVAVAPAVVAADCIVVVDTDIVTALIISLIHREYIAFFKIPLKFTDK